MSSVRAERCCCSTPAIAGFGEKDNTWWRPSKPPIAQPRPRHGLGSASQTGENLTSRQTRGRGWIRSYRSHVRETNPLRLVVTRFGLQKSRLRVSLRPMTTWWRSGRLFALLVAVLVTAGLNTSVVQANSMSVKMGAMQGMADGASNCAACPKSSDGSGKPVVCPPVCLASAIALPSQDAIPLMAIQAVIPSPSSFSPLHGRDFLPDPYPPRHAI